MSDLVTDTKSLCSDIGTELEQVLDQNMSVRVDLDEYGLLKLILYLDQVYIGHVAYNLDYKYGRSLWTAICYICADDKFRHKGYAIKLLKAGDIILREKVKRDSGVIGFWRFFLSKHKWTNFLKTRRIVEHREKGVIYFFS